MSDLNSYQLYVRDLVYLLREEASEASRTFAETRSPIEQARELALRGVLSLMKQQAVSFDLNQEDILLAGIDPMLDDLGPPKTGWQK